jgi:hypothetical protein
MASCDPVMRRPLWHYAHRLLQCGATPETIARAVHVEHRRLTAAFKALTPEPWCSFRILAFVR